MGLSVKIRKEMRGFSLDAQWVMGNELLVLFGYSGAGKSITLQMIAGLMAPDEGCISSGVRVFYDSSRRISIPTHRRPFGYVFQDLALFPHMTVEENIRYGANGMEKAERETRIGEMLKTFHLQGLGRRLPSEISGGQKQRVALARALMRRPEVLLLDEPFSALDNPLRREMRQLLTDIRQEFAIPIVLVTHDILEAHTLADRMIVYSHGRVVQTGSPAEVVSNPADDDVARLVSLQDSLAGHSLFSIG
ncbi:MAG: ATP-binding cassette domain-containing protein [Thermodesulfovibrionales bacterium]|jgi:molybdate transport system ATP-binding protein